MWEQEMHQRNITFGKAGAGIVPAIPPSRLSPIGHRPVPADQSREDTPNYTIAGQLVIALVSMQREVNLAEFQRHSRGKADICLARQIAMYLLHTVFSCPYHEVAEFFRRDRTTVSHACKLVEDLRDEPEFDRQMERMEAFLAMSRQMAEFRAGENGDEFTR
jgi:hypothetical protein